MKRVFGLLFLSGWAFGANGVSSPLVVSSGTYQGVSMYGNADGSNRQAIVIGDFSSSDTLRVDNITGIPVRLSTSALTTSGAVLVVTTQTLPVTGTFFQATQPVSFGAANIASVTPGTGTFPVSGTFFQATQPVSFGAAQVATVTPGTGTFPVSGTFFQATQPINIVNTATATFNGIGQPVTSTYTVVTTTYPINVVGTFSPPALTTVTFNGSSQPISSLATNIMTVTPGTGTFPVSGSFTSTPPAITTVSWQNQGAQSVISTYTVVTTTYPINVSGSFTATIPAITTVAWTSLGAQPVTSTSTVITSTYSVNVNLTNSPSVAQSGTWTVQPGNTQNTTSWLVTSTGAVVQGMAATGASPSGNPVQEGLVVSSAAWPTVQTDGKIQPVMGDKFGRPVIVEQASEGNMLYSTATITGTGLTVFISSPSAGIRTYLVGCIGNNSSATNTYMTIAPRGSGAGAGVITLGAPANDVPFGAFPAGTTLLTGDYASQVTVQANGSVSSIFLTCKYYQAP